MDINIAKENEKNQKLPEIFAVRGQNSGSVSHQKNNSFQFQSHFVSDDKDELLLNDLGARHQVSENSKEDVAPLKTEKDSTNKPKKVLEHSKSL